jgi:hypothetical protein
MDKQNLHSKSVDRSQELVDRFLDAIWMERGLSQNTLGAYRADLMTLGRSLSEQKKTIDSADKSDGGLVKPEQCRTPAILADAAHAILTRDSRKCSGNFFIDEEVLAQDGITHLERYAVQPGTPLFPDLFLD